MNTSTTESTSNHNHLEQMSTKDLLFYMNQEDQTVPLAVAQQAEQIEKLVEGVVERMKKGGRLFYIGAGTSGRLGVVDASECPPTFGVPHGWVVGIIAGGDSAIRKAVEFAEDDELQAWQDLQAYKPTKLDTVVGIAASGRTPYVIGGVNDAKQAGLLTGCITCNKGSALANVVDIPVEVVVGPEFVTGSTRMKAGTAQKLVLNMLSTAVMIRLGRVKGNKMIDMQLSNHKLVDRGVRMLMEELSISYADAQQLLDEHGQVRQAIEAWKKG